MTIRAAYGMFGDRMSMLSLSQEQFGSPFGNQRQCVGRESDQSVGELRRAAGIRSRQNPMPMLASLQGLGMSAPNIPFPTARHLRELAVEQISTRCT